MTEELMFKALKSHHDDDSLDGGCDYGVVVLLLAQVGVTGWYTKAMFDSLRTSYRPISEH
jgi:hypothetical protein